MSTTRHAVPEAELSQASLMDAAASAAARGEHDHALRLWSGARERFPTITLAWLRPAELLTRLRRFPEADALLDEAVSRFPEDFWLARARATVFRLMGDEVEAYTQVRALRRSFPDNPAAHADLVQLLLNQKHVAAAEAEARASLARLPDSRWVLHAYARCAEERGDDAAAATRWTELLARHPDHEQAYTGGVRALIATGRLQEAAGIAHSGARLLPASSSVREARDAVEMALPASTAELRAEPVSATGLLARALQAEASDAATEAVDAWNALLQQAPALPRASAGAAHALCRLGRFAEAEIILARARRDLPPDAGVLEAGATAAVARGDHATALARFRALQSAFPDAPVAAFGIARALHALGRLKQADAAFAALANRFPSHLALAREFASIAAERGDDAEAARRWTRVTAAFPDQADAWRHLADALLRAAQVTEADAVLSEAIRRFPDDLDIGLRWATCGPASGDPERRDELRRRFPDLAALLR